MSDDAGDCGGLVGHACSSDVGVGPIPAAGNAEAAIYGAAPAQVAVINGIEINRAAILEKAHELVLKRKK